MPRDPLAIVATAQSDILTSTLLATSADRLAFGVLSSTFERIKGSTAAVSTVAVLWAHLDSMEAQARLEYLRGELRAERISYGEIAELQSLVPYIAEGDSELLEAAGVPEFGI